MTLTTLHPCDNNRIYDLPIWVHNHARLQAGQQPLRGEIDLRVQTGPQPPAAAHDQQRAGAHAADDLQHDALLLGLGDANQRGHVHDVKLCEVFGRGGGLGAEEFHAMAGFAEGEAQGQRGGNCGGGIVDVENYNRVCCRSWPIWGWR